MVTKKKVVKKVVKNKKKKKCLNCNGTLFDIGQIKVGKVFDSHDLKYRSHQHHPYADHVALQEAFVCLKCGFTELFFNTEDLKAKIKKK